MIFLLKLIRQAFNILTALTLVINAGCFIFVLLLLNLPKDKRIMNWKPFINTVYIRCGSTFYLYHLITQVHERWNRWAKWRTDLLQLIWCEELETRGMSWFQKDSLSPQAPKLCTLKRNSAVLTSKYNNDVFDIQARDSVEFLFILSIFGIEGSLSN